MIVNKTSSVEEYQIANRFDSLREILKTEEYSRHLKKPLAYWALPTDRRLPLVLLGRTLGNLLEMSFTELTATPGIGQKKIRSFVGLLSRAANTDATDLSIDDIKPVGYIRVVTADEFAVIQGIFLVCKFYGFLGIVNGGHGAPMIHNDGSQISFTASDFQHIPSFPIRTFNDGHRFLIRRERKKILRPLSVDIIVETF